MLKSVINISYWFRKLPRPRDLSCVGCTTVVNGFHLFYPCPVCVTVSTEHKLQAFFIMQGILHYLSSSWLSELIKIQTK